LRAARAVRPIRENEGVNTLSRLDLVRWVAMG
jgi:hypothetical protein